MENFEHRWCVIMCGGIGSRFWPYSTEEKPKQFIDFLGTGRSLLQMTFDRVKEVVPVENVVIVSGERYRNLIMEQLPEIPDDNILLEQMRRNTAPCIAWASNYINAKDPEALILVTPSDHVVLNQREFEKVVNRGFEFARENDSLLTIGIHPNRPETGYGYIRIGEKAGNEIYKVSKFTEKPDLETAKSFLASGDYLWNAGIFIWSAESIIGALEEFLPEEQEAFQNYYNHIGWQTGTLSEIFGRCRSISIDYAVMEKADNVYVEKADMGWSDLGTWRALHGLKEKDAEGNSSINARIISREAENNIVMTDCGKTVAISGLENYIVADSETALLICPMADEQQIKSFVERLGK